MAETILSIVRNSNPDHVHFVSPFLASTIWLAAVVFLAYKYLSIANEGSQEYLLAESNEEVLKAIFRQFVQWWNMSDILETKLSEIEKELVRTRDLGRTPLSDAQQSSSGKRGSQCPLDLVDTSPDPLHLSYDSHETAASEDLLLNPLGQMATPRIQSGSIDTLGPSAARGFIQDGGSLVSTYEAGSGLLGGDYLCDIELQGFLDGLFATFRGQR